MYLFWKEFFSFGKVFESCSFITGKSVKGYKIYNPEAMKTINPYVVFFGYYMYEVFISIYFNSTRAKMVFFFKVNQ